MNSFVKTLPGVVLAVVGATAIGQEQPAALAEELDEVRATVIDVDKEQRLVSLRTEDGREVTLEAGPEVRNFDQIDVGETVVARFYEALAVEVTDAPPGSEPALIASTRAPVGERPAGGVAFVYTAVVEIDSVDVNEHIVKFTDSEGRPRELAVIRPEMQEFIAQLSPGDHVQVTYGSGLAIELEPTN
jgi:hypothetical protein